MPSFMNQTLLVLWSLQAYVMGQTLLVLWSVQSMLTRTPRESPQYARPRLFLSELSPVLPLKRL